MTAPVLPALERVLATLGAAGDIVQERVEEAAAPRWAVQRGWDRFLLALGEEELARCEAEGLTSVVDRIEGVPDDLRALAHEVRAATALERLPASPRPVFRGSLRRVAASKRVQLDGLLRLCEPHVRRARRVVDVGSGHGHVARWVGELFGRKALGLERDPERVRTARRLVAASPGVEFGVVDLGRDTVSLGPSDLAIGLHACGELGDATVRAAAAAPCDLVLVSCCFQKIRAVARAPLSSAARQAGMTLPREILGLANLSVRAEGVVGPIADTLRARRGRLALRMLLLERGFCLRQGQEMRGLNRRRAYGAVEHLAADALRVRGAPALRARELDRAVATADAAFERIRRLSLPRNMLGRLLEVAIVLDRARLLEEQGHAARVVQAFDEEASPRNLALVASAR